MPVKDALNFTCILCLLHSANTFFGHATLLHGCTESCSLHSTNVRQVLLLSTLAKLVTWTVSEMRRCLNKYSHNLTPYSPFLSSDMGHTSESKAHQ